MATLSPPHLVTVLVFMRKLSAWSKAAWLRHNKNSKWLRDLRPTSTQPPVAPAASRLQYGRRRNANALRERGHIELIEPILAIITVEK